MDGQTVVAAVHLAADWTSYLPVYPLDVVVDVALGSKYGIFNKLLPREVNVG